MNALGDLIAKARNDRRILAVLLYGSRARGDADAGSDTDIALVSAEEQTPEEAARTLADYLGFSGLDVRMFRGLPLSVQSRVLREGRVLLARDEEALCDVAFRSLREYGHFRRHYLDYLEAAARG